MKRRFILILFSVLVPVTISIIILIPGFNDRGDLWYVVQIALMLIAVILPALIIQYKILSKKSLSIRQLNIVLALNIDWFPQLAVALICCFLMFGSRGWPININDSFFLSIIVFPFWALFYTFPTNIMGITLLSLKLIMYILLRIALKQEQKNSNKKLHGRVTENIDTKKTKI